jgi:hypothetical protein
MFAVLHKEQKMSYIRFVWYRVRKIDGTETAHRWAENASPIEGRLILDQYHAENGFTKIAGPFKTRKEALQ